VIIQRHGRPRLVLHDPNDTADTLDSTEVGGFGEPMLALFVEQDAGNPESGAIAGINLTVATARELRDFLDAFIRRAEGGNTPDA
jgi:hypothetical protein